MDIEIGEEGSEFSRYVLIDRQGIVDEQEHRDRQAALDIAVARDCAVLIRTYIHAYTSLEWTPDGSDIWPPLPISDRNESDR